jgi:hypothetical protein
MVCLLPRRFPVVSKYDWCSKQGKQWLRYMRIDGCIRQRYMRMRSLRNAPKMATLWQSRCKVKCTATFWDVTPCGLVEVYQRFEEQLPSSGWKQQTVVRISDFHVPTPIGPGRVISLPVPWVWCRTSLQPAHLVYEPEYVIHCISNLTEEQSLWISHRRMHTDVRWKYNLSIIIIFLFFSSGETVLLILRPLFGLLYQPWMTDDDCGAICGMLIGRGNRSTRRKPSPAPLFVYHKPHMTWPRLEPGPPRWQAGD